jgi:hypothetical protein
MTKAVPPPPKRRRWLQFGMRSLLVAITLVAIPLGVIVNRAERQRRAVERIESLGGTVWYDYQYSIDPTGLRSFKINVEPTNWLSARRWLGNHYFDTAWHIQAVAMRPITDSNGEYLWLGPAPVPTDFSQDPAQAIDAVGQLRNLRSLNFSHSRMTDADLEHLLQLSSLERLELDGTEVTAAGLSRLLRSLTQLKILSIRNTGVTASEIKRLRRSAPNCFIQANPIELPQIDWGLNPLDAPAAK